MLRTAASLLLLWAVFGGPICGEICALQVAELPPCHAPAPNEVPADRERCCEDPDVFAAMSTIEVDRTPGAVALHAALDSTSRIDVRTARVLAHPPDPVARPFARTHRPLLI